MKTLKTTEYYSIAETLAKDPNNFQDDGLFPNFTDLDIWKAGFVDGMKHFNNVKLAAIIGKYPNDADLGKIIRDMIWDGE
jgi:hypothetical protein